MGTGEAQVKFTEIGSQQVVTAFKNVGTAAGSASTNVGNAGNAIKNVGTGMKNTASQIGNMATAFATLALSVVNTWRAYRDLNDQQLAIDKTTKKLHATELSIKNLKADIAKDTAANAKGSLNAAEAQAKLNVASENYNKHQKDGKHTSAQLKLEYIQLQKLRRAGVGDTAELTAKQEKLKIMEEGLVNINGTLKQQQKSYNDTVQDFYLSIAPLALSSIGSLSQAFGGIKGMLGGGASGLIGSFGGLGLVLGAASLAILAYQNNWLGFKDIVGGVIKWFQDRVGVWKETFGSIFDSIKKGNWGEAFGKIKAAAIAFWEDLKKSVPFFAGVANLVNALAHGQWGVAFTIIKQAALKFWSDLKTAVPLLANVEKIVTDISQGKWGDAFQTIVDTAKKIFSDSIGKGIEFLFGKNWISKLDAAIALWLAQASASKVHPIIELARDVNVTIKNLTGLDIAAWIKAHPVTTSIPMFGGITMMVDDPIFRASVMSGATLIVAKLGEALTDIAGLLDPYIAGLFKASNWIDALNSSVTEIKKIGQAIWDWIFQGIQGGIQGQDWTKLFFDIEKWMKKTMPETTAQLKENAKGGPLNQARQAGFELNPIVPDNFWTRFAHDIQVRLGVLHPEITPLVNDDPVKAWTTTVLPNQMANTKAVITPQANNTKLKATLKTDLDKVMRGKYPIPFTANMSEADKKWQAFVKKVENTKLSVNFGSSINIKKGSQAGAYGGPAKKKKKAQGGMHETLSRDTIIEAHRGERVDIHKKSETQMGYAGGKGINVKVFIGNEEFKGYIHTTVNEDQGNSK